VIRALAVIGLVVSMVVLSAISSDALASCDGTLRMNGVVFQIQGFKPLMHKPHAEYGAMPIYKKPVAKPKHKPVVKPKATTVIEKPAVGKVPRLEPTNVIRSVFNFVKDHFFNALILLLVGNELLQAYRTRKRILSKTKHDVAKRLSEAVPKKYDKKSKK
jgi:hypothetical protein